MVFGMLLLFVCCLLSSQISQSVASVKELVDPSVVITETMKISETAGLSVMVAMMMMAIHASFQR